LDRRLASMTRSRTIAVVQPTATTITRKSNLFGPRSSGVTWYDPSAMPAEVLQRDIWNGQPVELGHLFRLQKHRGDKRLDAICRLMSHQFGWEVILDVNGELQRSQVCRSQDEVLTTGERWRAAMTESGWQ
jgi:hypothetical protein